MEHGNGVMGTQSNDSPTTTELQRSRRSFLAVTGKAAVYTPPVMLGLSLPSLEAIAKSANCNNGVGNGADCLPPGLVNNGRGDLDNDDSGGVPGNPGNRGGNRRGN